jgi:hypothetical protein
MTDGCVHLLYNSSWKLHQLAAGQMLSGESVWHGKGRRYGRSITYIITLVESLFSSQPGGPPSLGQPTSLQSLCSPPTTHTLFLTVAKKGYLEENLKNLPAKGPPFPPRFCLGGSGNFVGSGSGQIQSVIKLLQNMVSNRTQHPPPPPSHTLSVYRTSTQGWGDEAERRLEGQSTLQTCSSYPWLLTRNVH